MCFCNCAGLNSQLGNSNTSRRGRRQLKSGRRGTGRVRVLNGSGTNEGKFGVLSKEKGNCVITRMRRDRDIIGGMIGGGKSGVVVTN
jgi:hypothetical protein